MKRVTLEIENSYERKTAALEEELSIGRTGEAQLVIGDAGLSRINTTFFRDGDDVLIADENSLNGTFLNGERIAGRPRVLRDGDEIRIGSETTIRISIDENFAGQFSGIRENFNKSKEQALNVYAGSGTNLDKSGSENNQNSSREFESPTANKPSLILIVAALFTFGIIGFGLVAYLVASKIEVNSADNKSKPTAQIKENAVIPVRVIDTLVIEEDEEELEALIASWTVELDEDFKQEDLQAVEVATDAPQLAVTAEYWAKQKAKAMEPRAGQGASSSVIIPPELQGNIGTQLSFMARTGITREKLPRDFVSLAQMRLNNELIELPLATETYYLDNIGTSANESPFNFFDIATKDKRVLMPNEEGFSILQRLAINYSGERYDLNNPKDRIKMKRRLLRMFHPKAKAVLEEIADAYFKQFKRPLKVTSLTRSLEYQYDLSKATSNAYRGQTPPHSTGLTFDIAYMHMTADEQNFIMKKFAELERAKRVDSFHERGQTPCIHTFVFP